jgi:hypothetical protein
MIIEDYISWWPTWYISFDAAFGAFCGIVIFQALADGGRFGSGYYGQKALKALIGILFCLLMLWPIPATIFFFRLLFRFNKSEIEEIIDYERKAYKKRGLDYDEEMWKQERAEYDKREAEDNARWRREREIERERWEQEEQMVRMGEQYFGDRQ